MLWINLPRYLIFTLCSWGLKPLVNAPLNRVLGTMMTWFHFLAWASIWEHPNMLWRAPCTAVHTTAFSHLHMELCQINSWCLSSQNHNKAYVLSGYIATGDTKRYVTTVQNVGNFAYMYIHLFDASMQCSLKVNDYNVVVVQARVGMTVASFSIKVDTMTVLRTSRRDEANLFDRPYNLPGSSGPAKVMSVIAFACVLSSHPTSADLPPLFVWFNPNS